MIFKRATSKKWEDGKTSYSLLINLDGTDRWMTCYNKVYEYATKYFKEGEQVEVEYKESNGKLYAGKITKVKSTATTVKPPAEPVKETTERPVITPPVVKEATEKPQYNQPDRYMNPKTPEESEQIYRLSLFSSIAQTVSTAMVGQVQDVGTLGEMIETLYEKFYTKLKV